ncbi:hypothetical protein DPMN_136682 [Dreissena polymorpha]|uniref:Uncharacterized protein n=1 Tax=Dreissena polymorpha TaxID=45954 RepID=A0A9D4G0A2_DREPO|nr:hypothetical protein DPMN_136682 [Dreissena polymorpha]
MPRRKRPSYGVQKKHKRTRLVLHESSPTSLDDGFLLDEDASMTENCEADTSLNTAFYEDKASQCGSPSSFTAPGSAEVGDLVEITVPTGVVSLRSDLSDIPKPFIINTHANDLEHCLHSVYIQIKAMAKHI